MKATFDRRLRALEHGTRECRPSLPIASLGLSKQTITELRDAWDGNSYRVTQLSDEALTEALRSRPWAH